MQHVEIHWAVERGSGAKWAWENEAGLNLHCFLLAPKALAAPLLNPWQMAANSAGASEPSLG